MEKISDGTSRVRKIIAGVKKLKTPKLFVMNPFKGKSLKENARYKMGEFGYNVETDENGRISRVFTGNLQMTKREERLTHNPKTPGKEKGDHAGHLIGDRFGGSPELDNLVSQTSTVNLSTFKVIENKWANAISPEPPPAQTVKVEIEVIYDENSLRPSAFKVRYSIDGNTESELITN